MLVTLMNKYWQDESGATAVEYALIVTTLSIIVISAIAVVGGHTTNTWNTVSDEFADNT